QHPPQARRPATHPRQLGQAFGVTLAAEDRDLEPVHRFLQLGDRMQVAVDLPVEQRDGETLRVEGADAGLPALAPVQLVQDLQRAAVQAEHEVRPADEYQRTALESQVPIAFDSGDLDQEPVAVVLQARLAAELLELRTGILDAQ